MSIPTFTKTGAKASSAAKLNKTVFGVEVTDHDLIKRAYNNYLANGRQVSATTLKRGEVRGGGKKPWKQKGTGRARAGSIRSPIWRGGGITFGPSGNENFSRTMPKKAKQLALRQALSLSSEAGKVVVIDELPGSAKTSDFTKFLSKVDAKRRILIVDQSPKDETRRATGNIENVELLSSNYVSVFKIMNADTLILTKTAVSELETRLGVK